MTKVTIIRGAFLNPFELQNYYPLAKKFDIQVVSSKHPISDKVKLPLVKLFALTDLLNIPFKYQILNRLFRDAHYLFGLNDVINQSDIVHVAETYYHYTLQAVEAKERGDIKKVVSTVWENIPHNNESLPGRKSIKEKVLTKIDHFMAVTEQAKQALISEGVDEKKITVISAGVDLARFTPGTFRPKVQNILFVGRLTPEKGVLELLETYKTLKQHFPSLKLTMIGDGPLKDKALSAGAEVSVVPYVGIHKEYQKADIFVLPSKDTNTWHEQFGMVLVEAAACGLPIVTTTAGAMKEVCGKSALYVEPGNSKELVETIEELINDPKIRQEYRKKSLENAKKYDTREISKKIEAVYRQVLR